MNKNIFKYGLLTGLLISIVIGFVFYFMFVKSPNIEISNIALIDLKGQKAETNIYKNKPLVINFWATWCKPCIEEMPEFEIMKKKYDGKVNFIFVSDDELKKIILFKDKKKFDLEFFQCEDLSKMGINIRPTTYFVNKDGTIQNTIVGSLDKNSLNERISELLNY